MPPFVEVVTTCPWCGRESRIAVSLHEAREWIRGAAVQDAFPNHAPDERERILTGVCDRCWKAAFADEAEIARQRARTAKAVRDSFQAPTIWGPE